MAAIKNVEGLTNNDINRELARGAKFVVFQYCFSIIVMTFKHSSDVYFIKAGESTTRHSIFHTLSTLVFGWWGIPWGPIYSIGALYTNLTGGKDVTNEVLSSINAAQPQQNA
ncbi:hypothetical protein [Cytophaga aurantiaca]|uniref:hypothetical protein n=1 Tax=Cytophaga aurantiaca TaxID=29530 RepID=UPI000372F4EB|nr:hypothetical protein [Cytophaga aurantiaca]